MRSVWIHYLTLAEYDQEVCRDDFEMAVVRDELHEAVESYDELSQVVVLMRLRCGHVALGTAPLGLDLDVSRRMGRMYFEGSYAGSLQLNLDDL